MATDWQPIETAPKDGRSILLYCDHYEEPFTIGGWLGAEDTGGWWFMGTGEPDAEPTHWMPLPEPPRG